MTTMQIAEHKRHDREMWAAGDYDAIAEMIWEVGEVIVERVGVSAGERALDLACGTGNAAIRAAQAGASVVGLDLTPELFDDARARAAAAGVEVEWVQGDAEAIPFEDAAFDVVLSTFGCMWAPRHAVTAREIVRVLRSGGRFGITNWTPEGNAGAFLRTMASYLPEAPDYADPPPLWGSEDHVRGLFAGLGIELELERREVVWEFASVDLAVEDFETKLGPVVVAREMLEPDRWRALRAEMRAFVERVDEGTDGTVVYPNEYLIAIGRKA